MALHCLLLASCWQTRSNFGYQHERHLTASHKPSLPPAHLPLSSRRCKDLIAAAFERSVDGGAASPLLDSRLHDFGFRCARSAR